MTITEQEWNDLKANETYGMYAALEKRIALLEAQLTRITVLENDFKAHVNHVGAHQL